MRMEVRCCCQPQKLLGTVEVPDSIGPDQPVHFGLTVNIPFVIKDRALVLPLIPRAESLTLYTDVWTDRYEERHIALKAEGVGLDVLRRIQSFEEAT